MMPSWRFLGAALCVALFSYACGDTPGGSSGGGDDVDSGPDVPDLEIDAGDLADPDADADPDSGSDLGADLASDADADLVDDCEPAPTCESDEACADGTICQRGLCATPVGADDYAPDESLRWTTRFALGPPGEITMLDVDGDGTPENLLGTLLGTAGVLREGFEDTLNELVEDAGFGYAMEVVLDEATCGAEPGTRRARVIMHVASLDLDHDGLPDVGATPVVELDRSSFDGERGPSCQLNEGSWNEASGTVATTGGAGCALTIPLFSGQTVHLEIGSLTMQFDENLSAFKANDDPTVQVGGWVSVQAIVDEANRLGAECACAGIDTTSPVAEWEVRGDSVRATCVQDVSGADACSNFEDGASCTELPNLCAAAELLGTAADVESGELPGVNDALSFGFQMTTEEATASEPPFIPELQAVGDHYLTNEALLWPIDLRAARVAPLRNDSYLAPVDTIQSVEVLSPTTGEVTATVSEDAEHIEVSVAAEWPGIGTDEVRLRYVLGDGDERASSAEVVMLVWGQTETPVLAPDSYTMTFGDDPLTLDVLANDTLEPTSYVGLAVVSGTVGSVALDESGRAFVYTPTQSGEDTFTYQVTLWNDNGGASEAVRSTVTVAVGCPAGAGGPTCAVCPSDCGTGSCSEGPEGTGACDCPEGTWGASCSACPDCGDGTCNAGPEGDGLCTCPDVGYTGTGTTSCADINECDDPLLCAPTSDCDNLPGDFDCRCPGETVGDGVTCVTPESCEEGGDVLCLIDERCVDVAAIEDWDCVPTGTLDIAATFEDEGLGYPGSVSLGADYLLMGGAEFGGNAIYYATPDTGTWAGEFLPDSFGPYVAADRTARQGLGGGGELSSGFLSFPDELEGFFVAAGFISVDELSPASFGWGAGFGIHDGLIVVGATGGDDVGIGGHVYLYDVTGESVTEIRDPAGIAGPSTVVDGFGSAVAVGAGAFVVGAPEAGTSGAAYVYTDDGEGGWDRQILEDARLGPQAYFGEAVAISEDGSVVVVGAPLGGFVLEESGSGVVFVYELGDEGYELVGTIEALTGGDARFGAAVAVDGRRIVVGAPFAGDSIEGEAYVFEPGRRSESWVLTDRFPGSSGEGLMGSSVAAANGRVLIIEPGTRRATLYETAAATTE